MHAVIMRPAGMRGNGHTILLNKKKTGNALVEWKNPPKETQCENSMKFSITQILREIKFEDSRRAKSAIFTYLEALDLDF